MAVYQDFKEEPNKGMRNGDTAAKQTQLICGGNFWLMIVFWGTSSASKKKGKWASEVLDYDTCFTKRISRGLLSNWEKSFLVTNLEVISNAKIIFLFFFTWKIILFLGLIVLERFFSA